MLIKDTNLVAREIFDLHLREADKKGCLGTFMK